MSGEGNSITSAKLVQIKTLFLKASLCLILISYICNSPLFFHMLSTVKEEFKAVSDLADLAALNKNF